MLNDSCEPTLTIHHKQGSTFNWAGTISLPAGTYTGRCSVVQSGTSVSKGNIVVTLGTPENLVYPIALFASGVATTLWNVPSLDCDIIFIDNQTPPNIYPSPTFRILVDKQVTKST